MRRIASFLLTLTIISAFSACSKEKDSSFLNEEEQIEITTVEQMHYDLPENYSDGYISFNYSPLWTDCDRLIGAEYLINDELELSIFYNTDKNTIITNDEYLDLFLPFEADAKDYQYTSNRGYTFVKEQSGESMHFRLATTTFVVNIAFYNYSDKYEDLVFSFIDTVYIKGNILERSANQQSASSTTSQNTNAVKKKKSFSGSGDTVTELFTADGCTKIKGSYSGDSAFVVMLYDEEAHFEGLVFSNSGQYNGEKVFRFENGKKYMFEITASNGDWSLSVE